ncbi:MAG: hypothetical protein A7316_08940 [Candidatus Altiarchaeales archaeon WOR_SM1_86-2]|nr:MAG: hypothetical protein A7316_08940 [Candidatus Altiarchaeales archaeon WOR_SM1_86-2]ODS40110.1 MAG: hypothetical protein A7315_09610 [Candidatus Altiarchaeales archaeon WOR_SM1_79]
MLYKGWKQNIIYKQKMEIQIKQKMTAEGDGNCRVSVTRNDEKGTTRVYAKNCKFPEFLEQLKQAEVKGS